MVASPRRLRTPLTAALVVLMAEVAIRLAAPSLPEPQTWPTPESQHKADQIEARGDARQPTAVVIAGASMADAGVDPAGLASATGAGSGLVYNAGLAGASLETIATWARSVLVPRLSPKVIVLGLSSVELNPNVPGNPSATRAFLDARPVRAATRRQRWLDRADGELAGLSDLYRFRTVLRTPLASAHPAARTGLQALLDPPLSGQGQALTFRDRPYRTFGARVLPVDYFRTLLVGGLLHDFEVGPAKLTELAGLVGDLRHSGVAVIIVNLPVTADFVAFHPRGATDYQRTASALAQLAAATGAAFVDGGVWDPALFADPVHLNGQGSGRLTIVLGPSVAAALAPRPGPVHTDPPGGGR